MKHMKKPKGCEICMAKGGLCEAHMDKGGQVKGVNSSYHEDSRKGISKAGNSVREMRFSKKDEDSRGVAEHKQAALDEHHKVLGQLVSDRGNRKYLSEGGEVEENDDMSDVMGSELISALDSKDSKKLMSSMEAIVLSCMNKGK